MPAGRQAGRRIVETVLAPTVCWLLCSLTPACADGPEAHSVELHVVDPQQQPLPGATVTLIGVFADNQPILWDPELNGTAPVFHCNASGHAVISVPAGQILKRPKDGLICRVSHREFVTAQPILRLRDSPMILALEQGRRIAVSAIDELSGQRIRDNLFAILSHHRPTEKWRALKNGMLISEGLALNRTHLRLVQLAQNGVTRFSRLIDLTANGPARRVLLQDVPVRDGVRLEGQLDAAVPRPVRNGMISVLVSGGGNDWHDRCEVAEDGTFVIAALPRGEVIRLTAVCEGWVSSNPSREELNGAGMGNSVRRVQPSRLYPQVLRTEQRRLHAVIRMEQAASCRVTVRDHRSNPVVGVSVRLLPWQGSFDGRSVILGQQACTRRQLRSGSNGSTNTQTSESDVPESAVSRYSALTGDDGMALITSLPGGPDGSPAMTSVSVSHPDYELLPHDGLGDRGLSRAVLYRGQTAEMIVRLQKKQKGLSAPAASQELSPLRE